MADYAKGSVLRELRAARGQTREQVAGDLGVTTKTLWAWENDGGIRAENAERLAAYFGVTAATVMHASPHGEDQLERIERKLDAILQLLEPPAE